jgi:hypothetical protein
MGTVIYGIAPADIDIDSAVNRNSGLEGRWASKGVREKSESGSEGEHAVFRRRDAN